MQRTTLYLPEPLLFRLQSASKSARKSVSSLVVDLVDKALSAQERGRLQHMYTELQKLEGVGPKGITDLSTTLDDVLYGHSQNTDTVSQ